MRLNILVASNWEYCCLLSCLSLVQFFLVLSYTCVSVTGVVSLSLLDLVYLSSFADSIVVLGDLVSRC